MPQVPYTPYPTADPIAGSGSRGVSIPSGIDAFGAGIAEAGKGLGGTLAHVGDELFQRAVALKELQNETEARQADADYMEQAGLKHAEFNALEGKARVDAFPEHIKNLKQIREDIRGGLSNQSAQKMYDSQSLSTMGRTIFNAAGAAASAQKSWSIGTAKAQIDLDAKTVEDNPSDDVLFQNKLNRVNAGAVNLGDLSGYDSVQTKDLSVKLRSQLWKQRIIGLSRDAPFKALQMLEANHTNLTQQDFLTVDQSVRTQARAVGASQIANDVYKDGLGDGTEPKMSLGDMEIVARKKAKSLMPNDPILAEHAVQTLRGVYNQDKYAKKQEDEENLDIVRQGYEKGVRDVRELRLDPKVAAAMDALPTKMREMIPGVINRYNDSRNKVTNQDNYIRLNGLAVNAPEEFLSKDLTHEQLGFADLKTLMAKQASLKKDQNADPRVGRAVVWMRGAMGAQMEALGIYRRDKNNPEDYDKFTGALQSALDNWQETHAKPPTYEEVTTKIAPQLLKTHSVPGFFNIGGYGTTNQEPFFKQEVPEAVKQKLTDDVTAITGSPPSEQEIYKAYVRERYIKDFGSKKDQAKVPGK